MKIGLRGGHSPNCKGAMSLRDEQECMRALYYHVERLLKEYGHTVIDCNSNANNANTDLRDGVNKANSNNVEYYISLHMNASNGKGHGTEAWTYNENSKANNIAKRLVNNYEKLGYTNRGVKYKSNFYEMRNVKAPNIIFETLFCDNTNDVDTWSRTSWEDHASAIANAIDTNIPFLQNDQNVSNTKPSMPENQKPQSSTGWFTNARALVSLDPRDNPSSRYKDLGEIYKNERIQILDEVCDKSSYLPVKYWKDSKGRESDKVWVSASQKYLAIDTNAAVVNVRTELNARYNPSSTSSKMGYVKNGEKLLVHKTEGNYKLATYFAGSGYKTAWFTAKYIK